MTELQTTDAPLAGEEIPGALVVSEPVARRRARRRASLASILIPPLLFGAFIIGIWYVISYLVIAPRRRFLLRPPHDVLQEGFLKWESLSELLDALWASSKVALIGLAISIVLGMLMAVIMSQAKLLERAMFPYLVILQAIPILAVVPLIAFWFKTGINARIIVCVLISLFPIIVNTLFGLQSADRGMHDLFTLQHVSRWTRLSKLMFPAAMPAIFAGLRISAGLSVIGAIVGDFFFARGEIGIGQVLRKYANNLDGEQLIAAVIVSSLLGVTVFLFFGWLQQRIVGRWYANAGAP